MTALLLACAAGHQEVAAMLVPPTLAADALNVQNAEGYTALMCAADKGVVGVVELLVKAGAKSELADKVRPVLLCCAGFFGLFVLMIFKKIIIQFILEAGAPFAAKFYELHLFFKKKIYIYIYR